MKYCPLCAAELVLQTVAERERLRCPTEQCDFIHWNNPIPVVAAIVEYGGQVILANNSAWPDHVYALITGFLEQGESPEHGVIREVLEELGLLAEVQAFIGAYSFFQKNQLILAYHVTATGTVRLNDELRAYKCVNKENLTYWDAGTGHALRDWLQRQGYDPALRSLR